MEVEDPAADRRGDLVTAEVITAAGAVIIRIHQAMVIAVIQRRPDNLRLHRQRVIRPHQRSRCRRPRPINPARGCGVRPPIT